MKQETLTYAHLLIILVKVFNLFCSHIIQGEYLRKTLFHFDTTASEMEVIYIVETIVTGECMV